MKMGKMNTTRQMLTTLSVVGAVLLCSSPLSARNVFGGNARTKVAKVCVKTPSLNQETLKSARGSGCGAAKDNLNARNTNTASGVVWSAVTTICTTACAKPTARLTCKYTTKGATAIEAGLAKNFSNALTPIQEQVTENIQKKTAEKIGQETAKNTVTGFEACTTAATSSVSAFTKIGSAKKSEKRIQTLFTEAKKLDGEDGNSKTNAPSLSDLNADKSALNAKIPGENTLCREENLRTAIGAISCAMKYDRSLPPEVKTTQFIKDLEIATGKPADQFFKNFKDPATSIAESVAPSLDQEQAEGLGTILSSLDQATGASLLDAESGEMIGDTGNRSSHSDDPEFDMNGILQKMLGSLEGEDGSAQNKDSGDANLENLHNAERKLASVTAENSTVSIFDRVKWRYLVLDGKQDFGGTQQAGLK